MLIRCCSSIELPNSSKYKGASALDTINWNPRLMMSFCEVDVFDMSGRVKPLDTSTGNFQSKSFFLLIQGLTTKSVVHTALITLFRFSTKMLIESFMMSAIRPVLGDKLSTITV